ncbi:flippase [Thermosulfurimonas dismutans]|uniref:Uncharacterized protein n=1 Tax=Thermosulfurimonas dismutans TaxID=999894 RepID=A0A179D4W8_9BACT|nr:flippase [Thermosulfurimonas dismutans]OAQ21125.1 hypothetical protein TDIS_0777 [Thermosulfurimonas dismutans]
MNTYTKAARGVFYHLLTYALSIPLAYVVRILYAHHLPKVEVGLFYALWDLFLLVALFRSLGVDQALVHYIPRFTARKEERHLPSLVLAALIIQLCATLTIAFILILLSPQIIHYFLNARGELTSYGQTAQRALILFALGYFTFSSFSDLLVAFFQARHRQGVVSLYRLLRTLLVLIFSVLLLKFLDNVYLPCLAYSLSALILVGVYGFWAYHEVKTRLPSSWIIPDSKKFYRHAKLILPYGLFIMASGAGHFILTYTDGLCLTYFGGLKAVAEYRNAATPTANILYYFGTSVSLVLFPIVSELKERKARDLLIQSLNKVFQYTLLLTLPVATLLIFYSKGIVNLFFGKNYLGAVTPLRILALGMIFSLLNNIGFAVLKGLEAPQLVTKAIYVGAALNLGLNLFLVPKYGAAGAGLATSLSFFVMNLSVFRFIKTILKYNIVKKEWFKIVLISLLSLGPVFIIKKWLGGTSYSTIIELISYITIYILVSTRLGLATKEAITIILAKK